MARKKGLAYTESPSEKKWMFNAPELVSRFDNLILKIKEGSG